MVSRGSFSPVKLKRRQLRREGPHGAFCQPLIFDKEVPARAFVDHVKNTAAKRIACLLGVYRFFEVLMHPAYEPILSLG